MKTGAIYSNKQAIVATIGFFDGVHRGHRYLIKQVSEIAASRSMDTAVITFSQHPRKVMQSEFTPELLTSCEEKQRLLKETGVHHVFLLAFTPELSRFSARQFMEVLRQDYNVRVLVIGYDHRFGHNRSEGFHDYVRYGKELDIEILPAEVYSEIEVSSSAIRRLLYNGNVSKANILLGYTYRLHGIVVGGYRNGREIGYPTANLQVTENDKLIPADGVYAVQVTIERENYGGMLSIGRRPTFKNGDNRSIEVHIFDFQKDIYNEPIEVAFIAHTRNILSFDSINELVTQLSKDKEEVKALLKNRIL
ncbi:MAG: bifunctional riboflavin kinase/FAD synthetase [Mediterranea massiliensis]|nr:bifunctional riboflavin kinase/FAD synthetase [Mediterranea massiliensis]